MKVKFEKAKPIMFSTDLVKAILNGEKTQTRRLVKPQPEIRNGETGVFEKMDDGTFQMQIDGYKGLIYDYPIKPKYFVGDILYVPECQSIDEHYTVYDAEEPIVKVTYKADNSTLYHHVSQKEWERLAKYDWSILGTTPKFISPYWTTKETARLFLEVVGVRVERLQDISEFDAADEGADGVISFANLWDSTIKKDRLNTDGWDVNPWVIVYTFKRIE